MIGVNNNCGLIICSLIIASIISIILLFIDWNANRQTKKVVQQKCKINRYEKRCYEGLGIWQIVDRLNNTKQIVSIYDLPDDIAEEIIDYSLKLLESGNYYNHLKNI